MQIKLQIEGQEKIFSAPFVKARMLRQAIEIGERMNANKKTAAIKDLDAMVDFIVELFSGQFTVDEFWDGISSEEFMPEIMRLVTECMPKSDPNVRKRGS